MSDSPAVELSYCVEPMAYIGPPDTETMQAVGDFFGSFGWKSALSTFLTDGFGIAGAGLSYGAALAIGIRGLQMGCPYLRGGKLVCIDHGAYRCALGTITSLEPPSDKSGFEAIDNDSCFNLLLAPFTIAEFKGLSAEAAYDHLTTPPKAPDPAAAFTWQGGLVKVNEAALEEGGMPVPAKPAPLPVHKAQAGGYFTTVSKGDDWYLPGAPEGTTTVPVLHCECEGDRITRMCNTVSDLTGPLQNFVDAIKSTGICEMPLIGKMVCDLLDWLPAVATALAAPIVVPMLLEAWFGANDGSARAWARDGAAYEVSRGMPVIVYGRWVYDAGHAGYNELHPVRSIQMVYPDAVTLRSAKPDGPPSERRRGYEDFDPHACDILAEVPDNHFAPHPPIPMYGSGGHAGPPGPGTLAPPPHPASIEALPPNARTVWEAQRLPEHRWLTHPALDGCTQQEAPPGRPEIR